MPYPRAHWWVLFVIGVILLGFWPSYWRPFTEVPWQFHAHGVAASIWVILVFTQSWTAHNKQLPVHRLSGRASLLLFPFLIAGLFAIIDFSGKNYVPGAPDVRSLFAAPFVIGLVVAVAAYVTVYYRALKFRRKVWIHSGYMLTTPIILFESPFGRVLNGFFPPLQIRGPADFLLVMDAILTGMAIELVFIAAIWWRYREKATPFIVAGAFIVVQMITMGTTNEVEWLKTALLEIKAMPSWIMVATGFTLGAATSWAGWNAGKRPVTKADRGAQAAAA